MKNISQIVNRLPTLLALGLSLAGLASLSACGQRGSLYIPTTPAAAQRATLVDALTTPPTTTPAPATAPITVTAPAPATSTPAPATNNTQPTK